MISLPLPYSRWQPTVPDTPLMCEDNLRQTQQGTQRSAFRIAQAAAAQDKEGCMVSQCSLTFAQQAGSVDVKSM